jgi:hypothetical protein
VETSPKRAPATHVIAELSLSREISEFGHDE